MARPLSSPSLSVPGSNWWEKKERLQNYERQCFGQKERREKKNLFPPHLNASLFTPIIISSTGPRITSANMSWARGEGHVWSERCQVFFLEDLKVTCAKYLLLFHLILIILLALNITELFMLQSSTGPEDWNNDALYWSHSIIATNSRGALGQQLSHDFSCIFSLFLFFVFFYIFVYFICAEVTFQFSAIDRFFSIC